MNLRHFSELGYLGEGIPYSTGSSKVSTHLTKAVQQKNTMHIFRCIKGNIWVHTHTHTHTSTVCWSCTEINCTSITWIILTDKFTSFIDYPGVASINIFTF